MRRNVIAAALVPVVLAMSSSADDVCSSSIYTQYMTVSGAASKLSSFCSSQFPVTPVTVTATATTTATVPDNVTETDTETDTITATTTETVTTTTTTSTTETDTADAVTTTTTVDYTTTTPIEKRTAQPKCRRYTTTMDSSSSTTTSDYLSGISSEALSALSTLCSCLEVPATTTDTITATATAVTTISGTITTTVSVTTTATTTTTETDTETDTATTTTTPTATATATCPATLPNACNADNNDGTCVDFLSDRANCGLCGNQCAEGQGCFNGVCKIPNQCTYSDSLQYCYGTDGPCACYETSEGNGFCGDSDGACGGACTVSDDCPGNNVCLTAESVGCGGQQNTCSTNDDLTVCNNPTNPNRLFRKRDDAFYGRKKPGDN